MKKVTRRPLISSLILVFIGFFLLSGTIMPKKPDNPLSVILQIEKKTYRLSAPITLNLIITNEKPNEPVELTFTSSQRYDFVVTKEDKEIWRWSKDKVFALMLGEIVLEPEESLHYTETWEQRDNKGKFALPGRYKVVGILKTYPEITAEPEVVEIKDSVATSQ